MVRDKSKKLSPKVEEWTVQNVGQWLEKNGFKKYKHLFCEIHEIDGMALLATNENDLRAPPLEIKVFGDIKRLSYAIRELQHKSQINLSPSMTYTVDGPIVSHHHTHTYKKRSKNYNSDSSDYGTSDGSFEDSHSSGKHKELKPEVWKTCVAMLYFISVTWITAIVMVIVHDRVPDMRTYPPLPDIFLDNVPLISWAFAMCELSGLVLFLVWVAILVLHKHRFILLRRMFSLFGSVFLLRCVTMLITSLSVPGKHLQCHARPYGNWHEKIVQAFIIWQGQGMSIQGVRTCGDYMFSGHTVALTLMNFFITEYTPRRLYFLHTFTWVFNLFGIFFILAAHEHYSIDVFIAFYISTRLFLYYHTLANNRALLQEDNKRTRIWFPLFYFFESGVDGIVPNEYEWPLKAPQFLKTLCSKWS